MQRSPPPLSFPPVMPQKQDNDFHHWDSAKKRQSVDTAKTEVSPPNLPFEKTARHPRNIDRRAPSLPSCGHPKHNPEAGAHAQAGSNNTRKSPCPAASRYEEQSRHTAKHGKHTANTPQAHGARWDNIARVYIPILVPFIPPHPPSRVFASSNPSDIGPRRGEASVNHYIPGLFPGRPAGECLDDAPSPRPPPPLPPPLPT